MKRRLGSASGLVLGLFLGLHLVDRWKGERGKGGTSAVPVQTWTMHREIREVALEATAAVQ